MASNKELHSLKLKDFEKNKENPFAENAVANIKITQRKQIVRATNKSEVSIIMSDEGEAIGHSQFVRFIEIDEEKFAKVYLNELSSFFELPNTAQRVISYILTQLKPNKDRFDFFIEDCLAYTKYKSKTQVYEGLVTLCSKGIIARGQTEYHYYINPLIVFNGNRVMFAKAYIKKKSTHIANQLDLEFESINNPVRKISSYTGLTDEQEEEFRYSDQDHQEGDEENN